MNRIYQQGDVILIRKALPKDAHPIKHPVRGHGFVLAEGEATGHAHVLDKTNVEMYEDDKGTVWVKVLEPATLVHEEHHALTIQPASYRLGKVREVDPFSEEIREVLD